MKNNLYLELTDRTKQIFKTVVESYLETGSPSCLLYTSDAADD